MFLLSSNRVRIDLLHILHLILKSYILIPFYTSYFPYEEKKCKQKQWEEELIWEYFFDNL